MGLNCLKHNKKKNEQPVKYLILLDITIAEMQFNDILWGKLQRESPAQSNTS